MSEQDNQPRPERHERFDKTIPGRHPVHYETLPHDKNCPDPKRCDCDCHGCVHARNGKVLSEKNRAWFIKTYGLPVRYLCAKDNYQIPEAY